MATYADPSVLSVNTGGKIQIGPVLVLIAGVLSLLAAGGVYFQSTQINSQDIQTRASINDRKNELVGLQKVAGEITKYQAISADLHRLFDTQKDWPNIITAIEPRLYTHMKLSSLQLNDQSTFVLNGVTATYDDYAKIYSSLNSTESKKYFKTVKPLGVARVEKTTIDSKGNVIPLIGQNEITFSFNITLTTQLLGTPKTLIK